MSNLPKSGFTPLASGSSAPANANTPVSAAIAAARASIAQTMAAGGQSSVGGPGAEFKMSIQAVLDEHLPRLEALAKATLEGM